ncbi:hypothetical protein [Cupriavidus sp. AcVe19-6a]|uniref:hypothetical protein n=1 Tax=Cupriavidus sp. AcVe19-6a TaxID=2821358 RepID=UPI001AE6BCA8|nr:hypothetical protein [Cupriavidus sp. AcVe19-6a]MBP0636304.1 hypothetical protein [Cupriavidus sp. AcVe19-6a]
MAALGLFYVSKGGVKLPPYELPGEQKWRTDFLQWHARSIVGKACLLPGHMRDGYLARAEEAQLEDGVLTELEVYGVFECARRTLQGMPGEPATREEWDVFTGRQDTEEMELKARRQAIFRGEENDDAS